MTSFIAPTVNLNGTSGPVLLEQVLTAREAVLDAFRALQAAAPNGRDYQTAKSPTDYRDARDQYNVWFKQLDDIAKGLEEIGFQISQQVTS
jgi:hypothetical protein